MEERESNKICLIIISFLREWALFTAGGGAGGQGDIEFVGSGNALSQVAILS